ncbi:hypothetical protein PVAND_004622 [Polypedilum vanderplanki]|uniref:Steroid dehydrogenase n=1 Tax=Polypedilum vanderplanki TaxID=319348 RepID=A0A9J6BYN6_POLVA|nr:hypothetical protein PVAND_004622 [Polypedilum vanderplanki]
MLLEFFFLVGLYSTLCYLHENLTSLFQIISSLLYEFFVKKRNLQEKYGEWAIVTGSSDGIGKEYAKELAKHGMNIVLISRTESKLIEVAKDIESMYSVKTKYVAVDFGNGKKIYEKVKEELKSMDIGILVNNVANMYDFPDEFDKKSEEMILKMLNVNIGAATMMSRMIIPQMKANKRGMIVNLSSTVQDQPIPLANVYASTKAYIKFFTIGIQKELKKFNVEVQLLTPSFVKTKANCFTRFYMHDAFFITPIESYVKSAVFTLGRSDESTGYWAHALQFALLKWIPRNIRMIFMHKIAKFYRRKHYENFESDKIK